MQKSYIWVGEVKGPSHLSEIAVSSATMEGSAAGGSFGKMFLPVGVRHSLDTLEARVG